MQVILKELQVSEYFNSYNCYCLQWFSDVFGKSSGPKAAGLDLPL